MTRIKSRADDFRRRVLDERGEDATSCKGAGDEGAEERMMADVVRRRRNVRVGDQLMADKVEAAGLPVEQQSCQKAGRAAAPLWRETG